MRQFLVVFIASVCVPAFAQVAPASNAALQFPVGPPTPKVGDIAKTRVVDLWNNSELLTGHSELVEIQADRLITRYRSSVNPEVRTFRFTREWNACRTMRNSDAIVCMGALKFPMEVGAKHSYDKLPNSSGRSTFAGNCEVKGAEKVTVGAGTFDAVRIECSGFYNRVFDGNWSGKFVETLWYAPSISRPVKSQYTDFNASGAVFDKNQTELVEFTPGK